MKRTSTLIVLTLLSAPAAAWDIGTPYGGHERYRSTARAQAHDPYSSSMPSDSYITPHVYGGGYTETYPGRGSITVNPNGFGGYSIHRSGFIPRSRW